MSMIFEQIPTPGIAVLSYLIGDDATGTAAVFDPCADVDRYVALARKRGLAITHIFETHIHADLISGARELQHRLGGQSRIFVSVEGGASYDFSHEAVRDGDRFEFGETVVTAKHTPGHTPEHLSYVLNEKNHLDVPWGVLSGDSLFVNSAGRPDLLGDDQTDQLVKQQFHTLRDFFCGLPDGVIVYPAHGHGSPCGADIGARLSTTIGYEKRFNEYLKFSDLKAFKDHALGSAPPVPTYYPRMKKVNSAGPEVLGNLPRIRPLSPQKFRKAVEDKTGVLVDTRHLLAFGGGHLSGSLNIGAEPMLSLWAGWLLAPDKPILLVTDDANLDQVLRLFVRTGYTLFAGYLTGGITAWENAGFPLARIPQMTVHELRERGTDKIQVVDVRSPGEWAAGHIPNAHHHFLPELGKQSSKLDRSRPTAVYCASGYRASMGASILKEAGFQEVYNVPGSFGAWKNSGYSVVKEAEAALR